MRQTVGYISQNMPDCIIYTKWHDLHTHAMEQAMLQGLFLEFGVKKGETIRELATMTPLTVHGFDSFQGLPEDWSGTSLRKGRFNKQGKLPKVPSNVVLHPGLFEETLPEFVRNYKEPVAYMHIDCDIYSSTKTILDHLNDRIIPGSVIVFDEYFNYPNWQQHEYKAFQEFISGRGLTYKYLGFLSYDSCVSVKIAGKI
jgi:Macrocin-O-methyltransferase (TylF).